MTEKITLEVKEYRKDRELKIALKNLVFAKKRQKIRENTQFQVIQTILFLNVRGLFYGSLQLAVIISSLIFKVISINEVNNLFIC